MTKTKAITAKPERLLEKKGGQPVSRKVAYQKAAAYFPEAFDAILDIMRTTKHDSTRLGAANKIIDKVLPDLKSSELIADEGVQVLIQVIKDTTLVDARNKGTTTDRELPSTTGDIQSSS